jgi:hypothetical protein
VVQWWRALCASGRGRSGTRRQSTTAGAQGAGAGRKGKTKSSSKGGRGVDKVSRSNGRVRRGEQTKKKGASEGVAERPLLSGRRQTTMDQYFRPAGGRSPKAHDTGVG